MADAAPMTKSAKQRMLKKARDEKAAAEAAAAKAAAAPPAPAPAPAAAKAKAKASANGYPAGQAKTAPAPAAAKKAAAPPAASNDGWTEASAKSKSKKAGAGKQSPAMQPAAAPAEDADPFTQYDDGTGGDWEVCTSSVAKKKERQSEKQREAELKKQAEEREEAQAAKDAQYRAKKAEKKAAKNGAAPAAPEPAPVAEPAPGAKAVRPDVQAAIAKVAAEAKAAAAKAAAGQAAKPAPAAKDDAEPAEPDNTIVVTVTVPEEKIGVVIGPKGARVREIEEKTGVVNINTNKTQFSIRGEPDKVPAAEKAIKDLITKGYMELSYENFTEASLMIYSSRVPDLIGKGGETIRHIKEKLNVEINVQKPPGGPGAKGPKGQKVKVDIAGSADGVAKCKECISSIMMFYHHELTHPCAVHEEIDVPQWGHALIIGKSGGEMRHIQNNFCVKVYIPREGETDNKHVVIVGGSADAKKAKEYIEKKLASSEAEWTEGKKSKDEEE